MPIKSATAADLTAMKERLSRRMEERRIESDIAEVVAMVNRHGNPTQPVLAEAASHPQEREKMGIRQIALMAAWVAIETVKQLKLLKAEDWLFVLALAMIGLIFAAIL